MKYGKYRPYSFSKISTYESCPKKFWYQYVSDLPLIKRPQVHFDKGKFIHLLLEHDGDIKKIKETTDFKEIKKNNLILQDLKEYYKIYKDFIESKVGKSLVNKKVLYKELPIGLDDNLNFTGYDDNPLLRGYIDAVYVDEKSNTLILTDWKSGKLKDKDKQSYKQLLFYGIALFDMIPFDRILMVYAYVEHNKINHRYLYRKDINKYKKAFYAIIDPIEKDTKFEKNETPLCNFCEFQEDCQV